MEEAKICLMCGVNSNKMKKWDRYNSVAPIKKTGKYRKDGESDSDSESDDSTSRKSKKKGSRKSSQRIPAASGSRQTRNKNPKTFATSLCKVMEVPATADEPFLEIFSRAHYCIDCKTKVTEVHGLQVELERVQTKIDEARVDFEIDLSKHLQKIPSTRALMRTNAYDLYEEDIKLILDYNGSEKKAKISGKQNETKPKRERRQAAITSTLEIKRKLEENGSEEYDDEEEKDVKDAKPRKKPKRNEGDDKDFLPEDGTSLDTEQKILTDSPVAEIKQETLLDNTDNGSNDTNKDDEEQKPGVNEEQKPSVNEESNLNEDSQSSKKIKSQRFKCHLCAIGRYYHTEENLAEHISKAHKYVCDVCEKTFKYESDMKKHQKIVHQGDSRNSFICGFCDKDFLLKRELEDHLDQHPQAKPLNCHQCGRGFNRKESLQKAFQIYKGETVEPCQNCGRNLNLKVYLEHNQNL